MLEKCHRFKLTNPFPIGVHALTFQARSGLAIAVLEKAPFESRKHEQEQQEQLFSIYTSPKLLAKQFTQSRHRILPLSQAKQPRLRQDVFRTYHLRPHCSYLRSQS